MAMLPVPYVIQSHGLSIEAFECGKSGKMVPTSFINLDTKQKAVYGRPRESLKRISFDRHVLRASAASDVSAVKTSEVVATYRFWMEIDGYVKVLVIKKNNNKYGLYVEVESSRLCEVQGDLIMVWGLFRADSTSLMGLNFQESIGDSKCGTTETPFVKDSVELDFEESVAPFYVSFLLKSRLDYNLKSLTIKSHRKTNFTVPVGFSSGRPSPLGISFLYDGSINFAIFSRNAESVVLCLYADTKSEKPALEINLDPYVNRSGDIWHALIHCSESFVSYGYRCRGGTNNKEQHVLLDPYAKVIEDFGLNLPKKYLGKLCKEPAFDWGGDFSPGLPMEKMIIYRLNVTRFTGDKSSKLPGNVAGSFSGVSEKLHHFKSLGVNTILLEPIFSFDEQKGPYYPWHFFSIGSLYGPSGDPITVVKSMKEMVKTLHANGIEVLLEVVFTHTSEFSALREIDNPSYYNVKGSRNALNCNHPVVQQLILESLRYWVIEFHIDGFSFINASSLTTGSQGELLLRPPLVEAIAFDPVLSKVKIIADSWDPHNAETEEITFPHWRRWAEMNAMFCVDVRNFLRGQGLISKLATRICGSGDLFLGGRGPSFSFNYVTKNSGLTLVDLVSFSSVELESQSSWNCGEEGPTNKAVVLETRLKQIRNFLFILFVSLGVPVLNMGDECGQSSGGSPAYADRTLFDWDALRSGFGIQVTQFISFLSSLKIRRCDLLQNKSFLKKDNIEWYGTDQLPPKWDDTSCKFLAVTLKTDPIIISGSPNMHGNLFVAFNSGDHSEEVSLPLLADGATWVCLVDTSLAYPGFFSVDGLPTKDGSATYGMKSHSCVLFEARGCGDLHS